METRSHRFFPPSNFCEDGNICFIRYHEVGPYVFTQIFHVCFINVLFILTLYLLAAWSYHITNIRIIVKNPIIYIVW